MKRTRELSQKRAQEHDADEREGDIEAEEQLDSEELEDDFEDSAESGDGLSMEEELSQYEVTLTLRRDFPIAEPSGPGDPRFILELPRDIWIALADELTLDDIVSVAGASASVKARFDSPVFFPVWQRFADRRYKPFFFQKDSIEEAQEVLLAPNYDKLFAEWTRMDPFRYYACGHLEKSLSVENDVCTQCLPQDYQIVARRQRKLDQLYAGLQEVFDEFDTD